MPTNFIPTVGGHKVGGHKVGGHKVCGHKVGGHKVCGHKVRCPLKNTQETDHAKKYEVYLKGNINWLAGD